jgi:hypothetical protein
MFLGQGSQTHIDSRAARGFKKVSRAAVWKGKGSAGSSIMNMPVKASIKKMTPFKFVLKTEKALNDLK